MENSIILYEENTEQKRIRELKAKFIQYFRQLPHHGLAAAYIGRTNDTISAWKRQDPEFSEAVDRAKAEFAMENVVQVKNKEWVLERLLRGEFSPPKQVHELQYNPQTEILRVLEIVEHGTSEVPTVDTNLLQE